MSEFIDKDPTELIGLLRQEARFAHGTSIDHNILERGADALEEFQARVDEEKLYAVYLAADEIVQDFEDSDAWTRLIGAVSAVKESQ